ncbi:pre-peptidase C-terminal domain-containing protein [Archangium violaceum]|uniref:endonuclease/exonuclease/phosphatase family protein n=1 Tax=Archangium violaceum TaxID=83451 RepID=UPI00193B986A|nr:endonuclease/exonuclease/phosphatase family protein [Archangium violaceum]QRK08687.1 pre-peptidase C-terminal domain-containing protein [Archangium violaceum]
MHQFPPSKRAAFGSWLLVPLLTLVLAACGEGSSVDSPEPTRDSVSSSGASLTEVRVRLMAANITSGNSQSYDPGHGTRIFQGTKPDVVMIQEFNYGNNSATAIRGFVDEAFGTGFYYYRESGAQIPNGVISRWPIIASGEWTDPYVSNRDFAWARIDIPGPKDLWVVSVHLLTSGSSVRNSEANSLVNYVKANIPAGDYLAIGGDFNTDSRSESCLSTFSQVVTTSGPHPADRNNNTNTNAGRSKPYDHVLVDADLRAYQTATVIGSSSFSAGLVVDTRVYSPLSEISPALSGDSGASNMQHMAVIKDFLLPGGDEPTPVGSVMVVAPNGGESWTAGSSRSLTWTASNVSNVKLEYTTDGSTWNVISASTPASAGSYTWTVPDTVTTAAKVRVSDAGNAAVTDSSDAAFSITSSTPPPDSSTVITKETENNDTAATANGRVAAGTSVSGTLSTSTDVDWFKFTVTTPGTVTVKLVMPGVADLDWYLYTADDVNLYAARGYSSSNPEVGSYSASTVGTYYVKVVGYAGAMSSYTLTVTGAGVQP